MPNEDNPTLEPLREGARYEFLNTRTVAVICDWVLINEAQISVYETVTVNNPWDGTEPGLYFGSDDTLGGCIGTFVISPAVIGAAYTIAEKAHGVIVSDLRQN